ncbi:MAG: hypothetical protein HDS43_03630 [Bacteroides sp.]|nr:hypothetical protein [Bacteroides sp.]
MMIASALILALKTVAVIGMLAGMIILLVGIRHFVTTPLPEETDALREEMEEENRVISDHSLFHDFLKSQEPSNNDSLAEAYQSDPISIDSRRPGSVSEL